MTDVTNQTVAELRASLGLASSSSFAPPTHHEHFPKHADQVKPRVKESRAQRLAGEIRAQFPRQGAPEEFMSEFPSVFALSGYMDAEPDQKLAVIHELIVDKDFTFIPRLGRIARRELQKAQLERLDAAIHQLSAQQKLPESCKEDSLVMVSCMVSEQAIWSLVAEIRDLMLDIVASKCEPEILDTVTEMLNPNLLTQMVTRGAYSSEQFMNMLDGIQHLIEQSAPLCMLRYDLWYSPVRLQLTTGQLGKLEDFPFLGMELVETLQDIKLDLANLKLSVYRPNLVEMGIEWEVQMSAINLHKLPELTKTITAIKAARAELCARGQPVTSASLHARVLLDLLTSGSPCEVPEVFDLDGYKLEQWRHRLTMIGLTCAMWTIGQAMLRKHGVEIRASLLTQIRCGMLDTSSQHTHMDHQGWALQFFYWLHSAAAEQGKALPVGEAECRLSNQLIAAAHPDGPLRKLMMQRITTMLGLREGFGNETPLDQQQRLRLGQCFSIVGSELGDILDGASVVAVHLSRLYHRMYLPFLQPLLLLQPVASQVVQLVDAKVCFEKWRSQISPDLEQQTIQLSLPGLKPLVYQRSSVKRSSSCGSLISLQRQSSCGEVAGPARPERQSTLDVPRAAP